jgi:hypothetical protein
MKHLLHTLGFLILPLGTTSIFAQKISGEVSDTNGAPHIGASVQVKGASLGKITATKGSLPLGNVALGSALFVSYQAMSLKKLR